MSKLSQADREAAQRQEKLDKFPAQVEFIEQKTSYKAKDVPDYVYQLIAEYARHKKPWVPITCEADLKQPPGLYWTTFISDNGLHVGSDRIYADDHLFAANTVAYMRVEEPEPWEDK